MPGYYIEWNKSKTKTVPNSFNSSNNIQLKICRNRNEKKKLKLNDSINKLTIDKNKFINYISLTKRFAVNNKENIFIKGGSYKLPEFALLKGIKDTSYSKTLDAGKDRKLPNERRYIPWAIIFTLFWILAGSFAILLGVISSPSTAFLFFALIALLFLILSLFFCSKAMQNGNNRGLIVCIILDLTLLLIGLISIQVGYI